MIKASALQGKWFEFKTSFSGKEKMKSKSFPFYTFKEDQTLETGIFDGSSLLVSPKQKTWDLEHRNYLDVTYLQIDGKLFFKFLSLENGILKLQSVQNGLILFLAKEVLVQL
jgi:hypothetical protein